MMEEAPFNNALHEQLMKVYAVTHHKTGKQMEYRDLIKDPDYKDAWLHSGANELGRLAKGVGSRIPTGTETIRFIPFTYFPPSALHASIICIYYLA